MLDYVIKDLIVYNIDFAFYCLIKKFLNYILGFIKTFSPFIHYHFCLCLYFTIFMLCFQHLCHESLVVLHLLERTK